MKEKLQEYALMAEIIGSIAIVVTLIILIINVRDNTNAIQVATIDNLNNGWEGLHESVINDQQFARVLIVGLYHPDELNDTEAAQFSMWLRMFRNQVGRVGSYNDIGLIPEEEYQDALRNLAWMYNTPGGRQVWNSEPRHKVTWGKLLEPYRDVDPEFIDLMMGRDVSEIK